jgi:enoyl-CoA hydratase/carnithine racemase
MSELVLHERLGEIAVLTLNNPRARNALSRDMQTRLLQLLQEIAADDDCRAIVLTGAEGHFCSGGDVSGMAQERTVAEGRERVNYAHGMVRALFAGPKPVIAAVEGFAAGAGLSLAAGADYLVASRTATFIAAFSRVGMIPDLGLLWSLPTRIGLGAAKHMIASARRVAATEAKELGLVDRLVEPGQLRDSAIGIAREFASGAPLPMAIIRAAYTRGLHTLEDALRTEIEAQPALYRSEDHREAVKAFAEKRPPVFRGR